MKVAMFGPFYGKPVAGGVEQHVFHLSNNLERLGVEVERWSWKIPSDAGGVRKFSLLGLGKALKDTDADLVHFHSTSIASSYFSGLGRFSSKSVATIHAFYEPRLESGLRMKVVGGLLSHPYASALRRIKNNIAVSNYTKQDAVGRGVPVEAVIGSGVDSEGMKKVKGGKKSEVVFVARLNVQKGVFDFIEAFASSGIDALIVGYGEPWMERKVREMAGKNGIGCVFGASREETLSLIKSSKVLAFPSRKETFGIVGLEAMGLGVPVVVYKEAGGPLDYVKDGWNGLAVNSTPSALKEGVLRLLKDEELRARAGKNALQTAKENDWANVAGKVKEFYSRVLE